MNWCARFFPSTVCSFPGGFPGKTSDPGQAGFFTTRKQRTQLDMKHYERIGWWQLKYFLWSPRSLGKWSNLTTVIFFKRVETTKLVKYHELQIVWHALRPIRWLEFCSWRPQRPCFSTWFYWYRNPDKPTAVSCLFPGVLCSTYDFICSPDPFLDIQNGDL